MSLIVHLMKKDAWYLRYELAIWLLLVAGQSVLLLSGVDAWVVEPDLRAQLRGLDFLWATGVVLSVLQTVIVFVIAAQLVQGDPLTGTTAFWRTRPIRNAALLASKLTFAAAALLVVPFVADTLTFVALGMGVPESLNAAASGILRQSALVLPAMALAAVTPGLAPCVVAGLLVFVGTFVMQWSMVQSAPRLFPVTSDQYSATLAATRILLLYAAAAASGVFVTVHQYLSLKTLRSMAFIPLAVLASLAVSNLWRVDLLERREPPLNPALFNPEPVTLSLDAHSITAPSITLRRKGETATYQRLSGEVGAAGAGPKLVVEPVSVTAELSLPGEVALRSTLRADLQRFRGRTSRYPQRELAMLNTLGGINWSNLDSTEGWEVSTRLIDVPEAVYRRHEETAGRYSAEVTLRAIRWEQVATLALQRGAGYERSSRRVRIIAVEPARPGLLGLLAIEAARSDLLVTLSETSLMPSWERNRTAGGRYILVNRSTREALFPEGERWMGVYNPNIFGQDGIFLTVERRNLVFRTRVGDPEHEVDAAWLAQAELVRVEPVSLGVFTKPLKVDEFVLKPLR